MSSGIGNRREKRVAAVVPVRLWGMDAQGRPFIEISRTVNISRSGVLLGDIPAKLSIGDIVGLTYAEKKHKFRVIWTGKAETPEAANVGLQSCGSSLGSGVFSRRRYGGRLRMRRYWPSSQILASGVAMSLRPRPCH